MTMRSAPGRRPQRYARAVRGDSADLRHGAPPWLRDLAREALLGWGRITASRRSTATLIVIGAQRAGTT